jgi:hypothetical protein
MELGSQLAALPEEGLEKDMFAPELDYMILGKHLFRCVGSQGCTKSP